MLGHNIFYGTGLVDQLMRIPDVDGGAAFAYWTAGAGSYGVVNFDETGKVIALQEDPRPNCAHT